MMRLGFHLEEAYLLILSVLILLAAVATCLLYTSDAADD